MQQLQFYIKRIYCNFFYCISLEQFINFSRRFYCKIGKKIDETFLSCIVLLKNIKNLLRMFLLDLKAVDK